MDNLINLQQLQNYWSTIITIISIIIAVISFIYKIKSNFTKMISKFIKDAENTELSNPEKMDLVISWIKDIIPRLFRVIFNDKVLRQIAENIYQDMKAYRDAYIKNKTGKETKEVIEIVTKTEEANNQEG